MKIRIISKIMISIAFLVVPIMIIASGCTKKVSTTDIKEIEKPEQGLLPSEPSPVYETVAEPPVPQPDVIRGNGKSGESGDITSGRTPASEKGVGDVFFDFDRYIIREDGVETLNHNSTVLRKIGFKNLVVEGHADERGTTDYNLALGERRAVSAKKYLSSLGIDSTRISVITFGKEKPFCAEHSEDCWQQNRRAHFVLAE
ncbi:MAG: OmpA family protein [Nitrospirae bacterium]|nr:OmpA family protein [Nitrospirota bacterium]